MKLQPKIISKKQDIESNNRWKKDLIKKQKEQAKREKTGKFYPVPGAVHNLQVFITDEDYQNKEKVSEIFKKYSFN